MGRFNQCFLRIISDLWWNKDGVDNYMSIKTVKPNIDQTAVAKQDCLHLVLSNPKCNAYFGLPYNPFGECKEDYSFNPPMGIFDFKHDSVVLIGKDMWIWCWNRFFRLCRVWFQWPGRVRVRCFRGGAGTLPRMLRPIARTV